MSRLLILALLLSPALFAQQPDTDHDGLPDSLEQQLLEKFRPTLMVSSDECDVAPAEFKPDRKTPIVAHRNGTIYGQAQPSKIPSPGMVTVELHSCDRNGTHAVRTNTSVIAQLKPSAMRDGSFRKAF